MVFSLLFQVNKFVSSPKRSLDLQMMIWAWALFNLQIEVLFAPLLFRKYTPRIRLFFFCFYNSLIGNDTNVLSNYDILCLKYSINSGFTGEEG